jgi:hypothetical protein
MAAIIQVAIGLIFIYSLLSILVTTLNTVITNFLRWRASHLKAALMALITDEEVQQALLSHPLINVITPEAPAAAAEAPVNPVPATRKEALQAGVGTVSNIDPKIFAQVLTSILAEKSAVEIYGPLLLAADALPDSAGKQHLLDVIYRVQNTGANTNELRNAIQGVEPELQAPLLTAVLGIEARVQVAQLTDEGSRLLPVLEGLRRINDDTFRRALRVVVGSAQSIDEAQKNIEDWFNQRMDQLSDTYKRHVTSLTLAIGLILTLLINADTLQMARALWEDPGLRETAVTIAQQAANDPRNAAAAAATPSPEATPDVSSSSIAANIADNAAQIQYTLSQLTSLNLPIGWEFTPISNSVCASDKPTLACNNQRNIWLLGPVNNPSWFSLILQKVIGVVITVIAIGQGAPFWFDLLRRLVNPGG